MPKSFSRFAGFFAALAEILHGTQGNASSRVQRSLVPPYHWLPKRQPDSHNWPQKGKNRNQRRRLSAAFQAMR